MKSKSRFLDQHELSNGGQKSYLLDQGKQYLGPSLNHTTVLNKYRETHISPHYALVYW